MSTKNFAIIFLTFYSISLTLILLSVGMFQQNAYSFQTDASSKGYLFKYVPNVSYPNSTVTSSELLNIAHHLNITTINFDTTYGLMFYVTNGSYAWCYHP